MEDRGHDWRIVGGDLKYSGIDDRDSFPVVLVYGESELVTCQYCGTQVQKAPYCESCGKTLGYPSNTTTSKSRDSDDSITLPFYEDEYAGPYWEDPFAGSFSFNS